MFQIILLVLLSTGVIQEGLAQQRISRLHCGDQIYKSSTTQLRFYDECWQLHHTDECIQGCIWDRSGLYHNNTFHFDPWYRWVRSDFGHYAETLTSEYHGCISRHNPREYAPDENCSALKPLLSCMRDSYEKVCQHRTENFIHTEADVHAGDKRCGDKAVPVPPEYLWYWNECSVIHGDWSECTKVCQWHKIGIINEDWSWNIEKINHWAEKLAPGLGDVMAEAQMQCVLQFGVLKADFKNDPTCRRFKPFLACWRDAYFNVCGHRSDWGIFSYKPQQSAMQCQGKIYHSSPDHLKAYDECSKNSNLNFNCRYVCQLRKQGHILDDGNYNMQKIKYQLRRENPDKAAVLFQHAKDCVKKSGPYQGSKDCNKVEPYVTCLQDAYLQECDSVTFDGLSSWDLSHSSIKCKHFTYHRSQQLLAVARECLKTTHSTYSRMACIWKQAGYIAENNTLNLEVWKQSIVNDFLYTHQELLKNLDQCTAAQSWPIQLGNDDSGIAPLLSCLRQGFFDACHYISLNFIHSLD